MGHRKKHIVKPSPPGDAAARVSGEESAQPDAESAAPAAASVPPGFYGNPDHLAKLKEGVEAWNKWREDNPSIKPDLRRIDFTRAEDFRGTPIWGRPWWDKNGSERVLLEYANLSGASLSVANLSGADLWRANLCGAYLWRAILSGADLAGANLSGAGLIDADVSGANMRSANLTDADVTLIRYDRKLLCNRGHGIRAESCHGNALFKRDVMDQDYLDQIEDRIRSGAGDRSHKRLEKLKWWVVALLNGFINGRALVLGLLIGLVVSALVLHHAADDAHRLANFGDTFGIAQSIRIAGAIVLASVAFAGFFAGTAGKLLIFKLWGLFDYGRSWVAVLVFAALMIGLFGTGYYAWDGSHVQLTGEASGHVVWFFPWFVALMGFATLGISSYATPLDSVGALLMMANVLSGFLTLGLLLSVLGNIFARRA